MPPVATPENDENQATEDTDSHRENKRGEYVNSLALFGGADPNRRQLSTREPDD